MVFCACGQGNRVPWNTTQDIPDAIPAALPVPVPESRAKPMREAQPAPSSPSPSEQASALPVPARRAGRLLGKVHPDFCYHHDEVPRSLTCSACQLPFCEACIVTLEGKQLCGPCKNFRVSSPGQARRLLPLSAIAFVVAFASGPVALTLSFAAAGLVIGEGMVGVGVALCFLASALPVAGLVLSTLALGRLDGRPQTAGRGLASSAVCTSLVAIVWCSTVALLMIARHIRN